MTADLQQYLKSRADIPTVYFNEAGEWVFFPRPGFDKSMTRDEVLAIKLSKDEKVIADAVAPVSSIDQAIIDKHAEDVKSFEAEKTEFDIEKNILLEERAAFDETNKQLLVTRTELDTRAAELDKRAGDYDFADAEIKGLKTKVADLEKALAAATKK